MSKFFPIATKDSGARSAVNVAIAVGSPSMVMYNPQSDVYQKGPQTGIQFKRGTSPEFRFWIIKDSREQLPWTFDKQFMIHQQALEVGDYTIGFKYERRLRVLDRVFVVERKGSAKEMVAMIGQERDRFQREIAKLRFITHPFIIVECSLEEFMEEAMLSGVNPTSAFGSVIAWQKYFPVIFAGNRTYAKEAFLVLARMFYRKYVLCHRRGKIGRGIVDERGEEDGEEE